MSRYQRNKKNKLSKVIHEQIRRQPNPATKPDLHTHESSSESDDDLFLSLRNSNKEAQELFLASINNESADQNFYNILPQSNQSASTSGLGEPTACSAAFLDLGKLN